MEDIVGIWRYGGGPIIVEISKNGFVIYFSLTVAKLDTFIKTGELEFTVHRDNHLIIDISNDSVCYRTNTNTNCGLNLVTDGANDIYNTIKQFKTNNFLTDDEVDELNKK